MLKFLAKLQPSPLNKHITLQLRTTLSSQSPLIYSDQQQAACLSFHL